MGQLRLMDDRKLYLCEDKTCFKVLNGDDFDGVGKLQAQILSYGKGNITKEGFVVAIKENFEIVENQIIWLIPSNIPRVEGQCCECKEIKSFQKWEAEHDGDRKSCNRCLLKHYSIEFFEKHFDKGHQEDFLDEMKREGKGRTLL